MSNTLPLGTRFTLALAAIFFVVLLATMSVLYISLTNIAREDVQEQARLLIETMNAVRGYTSEDIAPRLSEYIDLDNAATFVPETVPAHGATSVFNRLREQQGFGDFLYKEAALNPTNPADQADTYEAELVEAFRRDPGLEMQTGFRMRDGARVFYEAFPLKVSSPSCLRCHGDPADAPQSLITTYGNDRGFGWQLGSVVAVQTIYVPAEDVMGAAWSLVIRVTPVVLLAFALAMLVVQRLLASGVIRPVGVISRLAEAVASDRVSDRKLHDSELESVARRPDELGQMAQVFRRMAEEVYTREQKLKQKVQALQIEVDESRKQKEVAEIVDDKSFKELQERARQLRERRTRQQNASKDDK